MILSVPLLVFVPHINFYVQSNVKIMIIMILDEIIKVVLRSYRENSVGSTGGGRRGSPINITENGGVMNRPGTWMRSSGVIPWMKTRRSTVMSLCQIQTQRSIFF